MRWSLVFILMLAPAYGWQAVPHENGTAHRIEGRKISGHAETGGIPYILIEPVQHISELVPGTKLSYRNIVFNYGDTYVCGIEREIKIHIDGALVREPGAPDNWHVFRKGFLTSFFGEVLTFESFRKTGRSDDLATRLLNAKSSISFERKLDNCGDDGVFAFEVAR